jgi:hypothetical protein
MATKDVTQILNEVEDTAALEEFARAFLEQGGTPQDIQRLASPEGRAVMRHCAELAVRMPAREVFPFSVDYSMSLAEMLQAGNYTEVAPLLTEKNIPVGTGEAEVEGILVSYDRETKQDAIWLDFDYYGLRAAQVPELLAFGARYPEEQLKSAIYALGFRIRTSSGYDDVACLTGDTRFGYKRNAEHAQRPILGWHAGARFLAIRK